MCTCRFLSGVCIFKRYDMDVGSQRHVLQRHELSLLELTVPEPCHLQIPVVSIRLRSAAELQLLLLVAW